MNTCTRGLRRAGRGRDGGEAHPTALGREGVQQWCGYIGGGGGAVREAAWIARMCVGEEHFEAPHRGGWPWAQQTLSCHGGGPSACHPMSGLPSPRGWSCPGEKVGRLLSRQNGSQGNLVQGGDDGGAYRFGGRKETEGIYSLVFHSLCDGVEIGRDPEYQPPCFRVCNTVVSGWLSLFVASTSGREGAEDPRADTIHERICKGLEWEIYI